MASIFNYYDYAMQQATSVDDVLGVAKTWIERRQQNQLMKQQAAMQQAEHLRELAQEEREWQREVQKLTYQEEQRNLRHRDTHGVALDRAATMRAREQRGEREFAWQRHTFSVEQEMDRMKQIQDHNNRIRSDMRSQANTLYNQYKDVFETFGVAPPVVLSTPQQDEEENFIGYDNFFVAEGHRFDNIEHLNHFYRRRNAVIQKLQPIFDGQQVIKLQKELGPGEQEMLSREEIDRHFENMTNPDVPEVLREESINILINTTLAIDYERSEDRVTASTERARNEINHMATNLQTYARQLEDIPFKRTVRETLWGPEERRKPELVNVPLTTFMESMEEMRDVPWRWKEFTRHTDAATRDELIHMHERLSEMSRDGTFTTAYGAPFNMHKYGFYWDESAQLKFGRLPEALRQLDQTTYDEWTRDLREDRGAWQRDTDRRPFDVGVPDAPDEETFLDTEFNVEQQRRSLSPGFTGY